MIAGMNSNPEGSGLIQACSNGHNSGSKSTDTENGQSGWTEAALNKYAEDQVSKYGSIREQWLQYLAGQTFNKLKPEQQEKFIARMEDLEKPPPDKPS